MPEAVPKRNPGRPRKDGKPNRRLPAKIPDRYMDFVNGTLRVEDLDDEEVLRGQIRNKNGTFSGVPPRAIPREFHQAVVREVIHRAEGRLKSQLNLAMDTLVEIAGNPRAPADARFKAATYLLERVMGKIPEKQIVEATVKKWEENMEGLFVDVIDGEVVSDSRDAD